MAVIEDDGRIRRIIGRGAGSAAANLFGRVVESAAETVGSILNGPIESFRESVRSSERKRRSRWDEGPAGPTPAPPPGTAQLVRGVGYMGSRCSNDPGAKVYTSTQNDTVYNSGASGVYLNVVGDQITCLNEINIGAASDQRVGNAIRMNALRIKLAINVHPYGVRGTEWEQRPNIPLLARTLIIYDKQSNGAALNPGLALYLAASTVGGFQVLCGYNTDYAERFEILYDWTCELNGVANAPPNYTTGLIPITTEGSGKHFIDIVVPLGGRCAKYTATGGGYADIGSGALWLYTIGSPHTLAATTDAGCLYGAYNAELDYTDSH